MIHVTTSPFQNANYKVFPGLSIKTRRVVRPQLFSDKLQITIHKIPQ